MPTYSFPLPQSSFNPISRDRANLERMQVGGSLLQDHQFGQVSANSTGAVQPFANHFDFTGGVPQGLLGNGLTYSPYVNGGHGGYLDAGDASNANSAANKFGTGNPTADLQARTPVSYDAAVRSVAGGQSPTWNSQFNRWYGPADAQFGPGSPAYDNAAARFARLNQPIGTPALRVLQGRQFGWP